MDYQIFTTDKERAQAIQSLESLQETEGWKLVIKALDINVDHFDNQLRDKSFETLEELKLTQERRSDLQKLKQLPKLLIDEARNTLPDIDDTDIYDSPAAPQAQPKK